MIRFVYGLLLPSLAAAMPLEAQMGDAGRCRLHWPTRNTASKTD